MCFYIKMLLILKFLHFLQISNTLLAMSELVIEIELQLSSSAEMLARVLAFDGTVNETSLSDLLSEIELYNNSIIQLAAIAEQHLQELMTNQQQTNNLWMDIEEQDEYLYDLLANASAAKSNIDRANMLEMQLHTEYEALRLNLTSLSMKANTLHGQLALLNATAVNSTYMTEATGTTVQELLSSLQGLREQADMVLNLTQQLIYYTNTTQTASQQLVESTASLLVCLCRITISTTNISYKCIILHYVLTLNHSVHKHLHNISSYTHSGCFICCTTSCPECLH